MKTFAYVDNNGMPIQTYHSHNDSEPISLEGLTLVPGLAPPSSRYVFETAQWVGISQSPGEHFQFNWETKLWEDPRTLADIQRATNTAINKAWESANLSGFIHQGLFFATDVSSRSDIDGINGYIALTGTFPDGWAGVWKAKDNSYLPITTVEQWVAFYTSMVRAGNENFAKAQQLKAQIAAATTKEEVEAIAW